MFVRLHNMSISIRKVQKVFDHAADILFGGSSD